MLVLFGLKKKYDLNLSIVQLQGCDVNGRLKVILIVPRTQAIRETIGVVVEERWRRKSLVIAQQRNTHKEWSSRSKRKIFVIADR